MRDVEDYFVERIPTIYSITNSMYNHIRMGNGKNIVFMP